MFVKHSDPADGCAQWYFLYRSRIRASSCQPQLHASMLAFRCPMRISRGFSSVLGKPGLIDDLFQQAGYDDVETRKCAVVFKLGSARDFVDFTNAAAGPINQIMAKLRLRRKARRVGGDGREIEDFREERRLCRPLRSPAD